ncbi:hypothetical protein OF846_001830 [Rhodotorula toruloides]|nr:hypothetical protein OF846_001830 [Rhodotorula toruloides]
MFTISSPTCGLRAERAGTVSFICLFSGFASCTALKNSTTGFATHLLGRNRPSNHPRCPPCIVRAKMRFGFDSTAEKGIPPEQTIGSSCAEIARTGTVAWCRTLLAEAWR